MLRTCSWTNIGPSVKIHVSRTCKLELVLRRFHFAGESRAREHSYPSALCGMLQTSCVQCRQWRAWQKLALQLPHGFELSEKAPARFLVDALPSCVRQANTLSFKSRSTVDLEIDGRAVPQSARPQYSVKALPAFIYLTYPAQCYLVGSLGALPCLYKERSH